MEKQKKEQGGSNKLSIWPYDDLRRIMNEEIEKRIEDAQARETIYRLLHQN